MRKILVALTAALAVGMGVPTATADGDHDVEIRDGAFAPERLQVRAGDTVEWKNEGERPHSVTADGGAFHSGILEPGRDFEARMNEPGTFRYRSTAEGDEGMVGFVVVLPAEGDDSSGPGDGSSGTDHGSSGPGGDGTSDDPIADGSVEGASGNAGSEGGSSADGASADGGAGDPSGSARASARPGDPSARSSRAVLAQAAAVSIQDDVFVPARVEIDAGGTVVWEHTGERPHTVTASDGSFDSGTLETGASFSQAFPQPGTYSYYCRFHGTAGGDGMAGVVVVQGAAQPGNAEEDAPGAAGDQTGGLAATGSSPAIPLGAALVLLAAGLWAVRLSRPRKRIPRA